jgi:hypothetical protein
MKVEKAPEGDAKSTRKSRRLMNATKREINKSASLFPLLL